MSLEPQKFFIGVIDFFSILLPGVLLAFLARGWAEPILAGVSNRPPRGTEGWIVFLVASYLLGHLAFLLGSQVDRLYDRLRKCTALGQSERLAEGKGLSHASMRAFAGWLFKDDADAAVTQAVRFKSRALQALSAEKAINAFQWCKARLSKEHPAGLASVQRFEADSKFFRSFTVVLAALVLFNLFERRWLTAATCAIVLLLALWRYMDQRFKATQQAYWFIITLESMKAAPPTARPNGLTHAGSVVFRMHNGSPQSLLVQATKDRAQWVLPKGHIEAGEDPRVTAVREVREETGHWARVVQGMRNVQFGSGAGAATVRFFLMELAEEGKAPCAQGRQHKWLVLPQAQQEAEFRESKDLLAQAEELCGHREPPKDEKPVGQPA